MNQLRDGLLAGLSLVSLAVAAPHASAATASAADADGTPQLLTELQFNSTASMTTAAVVPLASKAVSASGWSFGAQAGGSIGVQSTSSPQSATASANALVGTYPNQAPGGQYIWADFNVAALHTEDIYIEYWAKMPSTFKGGCKFIKVFGERITPTNYADTTIVTDYSGVQFGEIRQISFGDGTGVTNDSQNVVNINGTSPSMIGRSYGAAVVNTPQMADFPAAAWGTTWHHFRIHVKFNDGTTSQNQVPDGEYYLEIDGNVYVDATGLYNRNPSNGPIDYVELFGWAQADTQPFQLWYDDVRISTGGFMSTPLPNPPGNVGAKVTTN